MATTHKTLAERHDEIKKKKPKLRKKGSVQTVIKGGKKYTTKDGETTITDMATGKVTGSGRSGASDPTQKRNATYTPPATTEPDPNIIGPGDARTIGTRLAPTILPSKRKKPKARPKIR